MRTWLVLLFTLSFSLQGSAATFYLDPVNGNLSNPGTSAAPWPSLKEVIDANLIQTQEYSPLPYDALTSKLIPKNAGAPVQAGDTLMLLDGLHGEIEIDRHVNAGYITIRAAPNHQPVLATLHFRSSAFWRVEGVTISSEPYGYYTDSHLLFVESHGWRGPADHIEIVNCTLYSGEDSWEWTLDEWLGRVTNGIIISGDHVRVENCLVTNIYMGISLVGDSLIARNNQVINFAGDGMRALGAHQLIEGNLIKNCFDIDDNHDDGIQSFNLGTYDVQDVIIRGNTILNYDDPNQPLLGPLQGIGCFDGPFTDWVIENNVISVNHWHGISLYGAVNCRVINNTVIDPTPDVTPGPSWILITDNKDGTPSTGCEVKNNISNTLNVEGLESHNLKLGTQAAYTYQFTNPAGFDFHLHVGSTAIDAGDENGAPFIDIEGTKRPQGAGIDIGAFEFIPVTFIHPEMVSKIDIFPNPARESFLIRMPGIHSRIVECILSDMNGHLFPCRTASGTDSIRVFRDELPAGPYQISLNIGPSNQYSGLIMLID